LNWTRLLIRSASAFLILFLMGYLIPGFSGFTYLHLLATALVVGLTSSLVDLFIKPNTAWERSVIVFLTSAVVVYVYSMLVARMRPPLSGTVLSAALIGLIDLVFPERPSVDLEREEVEPRS